LSSAIDKVDFENPVTRVSIGSEVAHAAWILRMDVKTDLVTRNFLVRELPQQVACDRTAVFPAIFRRQVLRMPVELRGGDVGMLLEILLALDERFADVVAQPP
jgi:hypothetical protein